MCNAINLQTTINSKSLSKISTRQSRRKLSFSVEDRGVEDGEEDDEVVQVGEQSAEDAMNYVTNEVTVDNAKNHEVPEGTVLVDATDVTPPAENSIDDNITNTQYEGEAWDKEDEENEVMLLCTAEVISVKSSSSC